MVPANGSKVFSNIPANTWVTLNAQGGGYCSFSYWMIDGTSSETNPQPLLMNRNHTATAGCYSGEVIIGSVPAVDISSVNDLTKTSLVAVMETIRWALQL